MSFDIGYYPDMPAEHEELRLRCFDGYAGLYTTSGHAGRGQAAQAARRQPRQPAAAQAAPRSSDFYGLSLQLIAAGRQDELYARYFFDIRPATDDKPYYSGYIKPRTIPLLLRHLGRISEEWGYLLLLGTFLQSLVFGLLIIVLPLRVPQAGALCRPKGNPRGDCLLRLSRPGLHDGGDLSHPALRRTSSPTRSTRTPSSSRSS